MHRSVVHHHGLACAERHHHAFGETSRGLVRGEVTMIDRAHERNAEVAAGDHAERSALVVEVVERAPHRCRAAPRLVDERPVQVLRYRRAARPFHRKIGEQHPVVVEVASHAVGECVLDRVQHGTPVFETIVVQRRVESVSERRVPLHVVIEQVVGALDLGHLVGSQQVDHDVAVLVEVRLLLGVPQHACAIARRGDRQLRRRSGYRRRARTPRARRVAARAEQSGDREVGRVGHDAHGSSPSGAFTHVERPEPRPVGHLEPFDSIVGPSVVVKQRSTHGHRGDRDHRARRVGGVGPRCMGNRMVGDEHVARRHRNRRHVVDGEIAERVPTAEWKAWAASRSDQDAVAPRENGECAVAVVDVDEWNPQVQRPVEVLIDHRPVLVRPHGAVLVGELHEEPDIQHLVADEEVVHQTLADRSDALEQRLAVLDVMALGRTRKAVPCAPERVGGDRTEIGEI